MTITVYIYSEIMTSFKALFDVITSMSLRPLLSENGPIYYLSKIEIWKWDNSFTFVTIVPGAKNGSAEKK